jgi:ribosomal protein S18 acetylase RimI-like enzyme
LDNEIIGGITGHILPSTYFTTPEVYLFDLAVKTEHQRKGIGTGLIESFNQYCLLQGYRDVFVQADSEDDHAIDFYRKTGGQETSVVHFTYPLKKD